jgi:hypothetical protein
MDSESLLIIAVAEEAVLFQLISEVCMVIKQEVIIQTMLQLAYPALQDTQLQRFQGQQTSTGISMYVVEKFLIQPLLLQLSFGILEACMAVEVLSLQVLVKSIRIQVLLHVLQDILQLRFFEMVT